MKHNFLRKMEKEWLLLGTPSDTYTYKSEAHAQKVRATLRKLIDLYNDGVTKVGSTYVDNNTDWSLMTEVGEMGWTQE